MIQLFMLLILLNGSALQLQSNQLAGKAGLAAAEIKRDETLAIPPRCLPSDVNLTDMTTSEDGRSNMTVEQKLTTLKARCRKGKLVDGKNREIRFFKFDCWGNPPADYQEIRKKQEEELTKLKKRYNVIVIKCDPRSVL